MNYLRLLTVLSGAFGLLSASPKLHYGNTEDLEYGLTEPKLPLVVNGNKQYYFGGIFEGTRTEADIFCNLIGMRLVSIEPNEQQFITDTLNKYFIMKHTGKFWTSGMKFGDSWIWESKVAYIDESLWEQTPGTEDYVVASYDRNTKSPVKLQTATEPTIGFTICESDVPK